jgi:ribosomal protein S18 acetylase RimI-like enzyme
MTVLRFAPASSLTRPALVQLFNDGYSGYEVATHLDETAFAFMTRLVDLDLDRSVVAYEGDQLAAMAMLAHRGERAWIGGMGVVPACRGRGYGADVMRAAIDNARQVGARRLDLEVLEGNAHAIRIYERLGFTHTRRLVVWLIDPSAAVLPTSLPALDTLDPATGLALAERWQAAAPWQRARETIANLPAPPIALGVRENGEMRGVVVYRAVPERVSVLALGDADGRPDRLEALLAVVLSRSPGSSLRLLNLPVGDPAEGPIQRLGARVEARQFEMTLGL